MIEEDKILLLRLKNGDADAFEKIYNNTYPIIRSYILNIIENNSFSDDILEEVFINLWEKRNNLSNDISIKSYLFISARNACFDFIRKKNVRDSYKRKIEKKYEIENSYNPFNSSQYTIIENKELKNALQNAIDELPKKCRKVFKLSRYYKYKNKEISRLLKISESTVEMHMRTAITKLKHKLSDFF